MQKRFFNSFALLYSSFLFSVQILAQSTWYINKSATGSNNGTSLSNGWKNFSYINWNNIKPGDMIVVADGIYNDQLQLFSGQNNITITGTGNTILDGQNSIDDGIYIDGTTHPVDNIYIKNLTFRNYTWAGIYGDGETTGRLSNITIDSCIFYDNIRSCVFFEGQDNIVNNYNLVIKNCNMNTPDNNDAQTDLIYVQYVNDLTVDNCYLMVDNVAFAGHNDCIQTYWVDNTTLINNIAIQNNSKYTETQCFDIENGNGTHKIFNNIAYDVCNGNTADAKLFYQRSDNSAKAHAIFLNNTIYAHGGGMIDSQDPNAIIENNILYCTGVATTGTSTTSMIDFESGRGANAIVDYNLYYDPTHEMIPSDGDAGSHSVYGNPLFMNISSPLSFDLGIGATSPAINAGANLSNYFTTDANNHQRPATGPWDIGAYQHSSLADTQTGQNIPVTFILYQNYPNPFNPGTTIKYTIPAEGNVSIKIYDMVGKEVATILNEYKPAGTYTIKYNPKSLSSGVYFYRITSGSLTQTKKMIILK